MYMGAYGIGIERAMAIVVESHHDEKGIIWPESIAPYKLHLIGLNLENEEIKQKAFGIYQTLRKMNIDVLFHDRTDVTAGEKFADSDLIGIPLRVVISKRTEGKIELKKRSEKESMLVDLEEFLSNLK